MFSKNNTLSLCPFTCRNAGNLVLASNPKTEVKQAQQDHLQIDNLYDNAISVSCFTTIDSISSDWEQATDPNNLFLQRRFLKIVEQCPPENVDFCYLVFYKKDKAIGVATCQTIPFNTGAAVRHEEEGETVSSWEQVKTSVKSYLAKKINFHLLVCGSVLLTGEHHFYFSDASLPKDIAYQLVDRGLIYAQKELKKIGRETHAVLIKDVTEANHQYADNFINSSLPFTEFQWDPCMVFHLQEEWKTFDDYLQAMLSKYRMRAKRALKKGADFKKVNFTASDIEANLDRINELYHFIADGADFGMAKLHPRYFLALKQQLQQDFQLTAYYLDDQLVAFYTTIRNHDELEAHFLGFESQLNRSHQVYLNMLYDMVADAIEQGAKSIVYARTALEIKSSVGAVAEEVYCYLRHKNQLPNLFVKKAVGQYQPEIDWTPRHPFGK